MSKVFGEIAKELEARGAVDEALQLKRIANRKEVPASVIETIRILSIVQAKASEDPKLDRMAARTSLLSHQIQQRYFKG